MSEKSRAQLSIEATMLLGIAIIVLISFVNLNWERYYLAAEIGESGEARMVGELFATAINNVYANGEGFSLEIGSDMIDFDVLGNTSSTSGLSMDLPITISTSSRTIIISRSMARSGMASWKTSINIFPANITRLDSTADYPELTVKNNGSNIIIYANSSNVDVVS